MSSILITNFGLQPMSRTGTRSLSFFFLFSRRQWRVDRQCSTQQLDSIAVFQNSIQRPFGTSNESESPWFPNRVDRNENICKISELTKQLLEILGCRLERQVSYKQFVLVGSFCGRTTFLEPRMNTHKDRTSRDLRLVFLLLICSLGRTLETRRGRSPTSIPFNASTALRISSSEFTSTKANPLISPDASLRGILMYPHSTCFSNISLNSIKVMPAANTTQIWMRFHLLRRGCFAEIPPIIATYRKEDCRHRLYVFLLDQRPPKLRHPLVHQPHRLTPMDYRSTGWGRCSTILDDTHMAADRLQATRKRPTSCSPETRSKLI